MNHPLLSSNRGFTLIELLATLTLIGIVSITIICYFTGGLNSYRSVNEQITLHDEANYIMRRFENEILEATTVQQKTPFTGPCEDSYQCFDMIEIIKMNDDIVKLGFTNHQAQIDDETLHSPKLKISEDSMFRIKNDSQNKLPKEDIVYIRLIIEDPNSTQDNKITLESRIPYIKVEKVKNEIGGDENGTENKE